MRKPVTQVKEGDIILWQDEECKVLYCGPHEMAGGLHEVFVKDKELGERVFSIRSSEKLEVVSK